MTKVDADLDAACGKTVFIKWTFSLEKKHDCDGYVVQKIDDYCDILKCEACKDCKPSLPKKPTTFYEAWFVPKGEVVDEKYKERKYTDMSTITMSKDSCGEVRTIGTIRFFCVTITGDLGKPGKPPTPPKDPKSPWGPNKSYGKGNCVTKPGSLPSTGDVPDWWAKGDNDGEKPAERQIYGKWNCCPGKDEHKAIASPD